MKETDDPHDNCSHWAGKMLVCWLDIHEPDTEVLLLVNKYSLESNLHARHPETVTSYPMTNKNTGIPAWSPECTSINEVIPRTVLPLVLYDSEDLGYCHQAKKLWDKYHA